MERDSRKDRAADALLAALNRAAAALIDLDPDGKQKLAKLDGKILCLEITAPPLRLCLRPTQRGLEFHRGAESESESESEPQPDVTLSGPLTAFVRLGRRGAGAAGVLSEGRVTVRGDAELGREFQAILADLDLDWEELLARTIGDAPARKVGNALRAAAGWAGQSFDLARENAGDYWKEEKRMLAGDVAMERFERALNRTRADVDRLTRRVERLKRAFVSASSAPPAQSDRRDHPNPQDQRDSPDSPEPSEPSDSSDSSDSSRSSDPPAHSAQSDRRDHPNPQDQRDSPDPPNPPNQRPPR